jgi:F0F1-type ATP synthase assembly protein I
VKERRPEGESQVRWLGRTYQGALEAVLAIVIMAVIGAYADSHFDTAPVLFLVGLAIGFGSFVLRLLRLLKEVQTPPEDDGGAAG